MKKVFSWIAILAIFLVVVNANGMIKENSKDNSNHVKKMQNAVIQNGSFLTGNNYECERNYALVSQQWTAPDIALNNLTKVNIEQITMNAKVDIKKLTNQLKC